MRSVCTVRATPDGWVHVQITMDCAANGDNNVDNKCSTYCTDSTLHQHRVTYIVAVTACPAVFKVLLEIHLTCKL